MANRKEIILNAYEASRIDYLGAFMRLWVSFNTWYNDKLMSRYPDSEQQRVIGCGSISSLSAPYWVAMDGLNNPAPDDNSLHVVSTVEGLSTTEFTDVSGAKQSSKTDDTGFKYRLLCNRQNTHTRFTELCRLDAELQDWCSGLAMFNTKSRADQLFKAVYLGYKSHRASSAGIVLDYDVVTHIPDYLVSMGVSQYGCLLIHKLQQDHADACDITDRKALFGPAFERKITLAARFTGKSGVKRRFNGLGSKGKTYRFVEARGLDLLERELLLLYKFRSSVIHGERDPKSDTVQKLAKAAYSALDELMVPIF